MASLATSQDNYDDSVFVCLCSNKPIGSVVLEITSNTNFT